MVIVSKNRKIKYFEIGLYIFVALIVFIVPVFIHFQSDKKWDMVFMEWLRLTPFAVIFLVNNFLLAPKLLFKSKYWAYIISCLGLLLLVIVLNNVLLKPQLLHPKMHPDKEAFLQKENFKRDNAPFPPYHEIGENPIPNGRPLPPRKLFFSFGIFSIGLLVIGFNSGVKVFVRWTIETEERNEKERHYLSTELAFLKQQISPHFFMNTLNNIHALIDIDSERAKDCVVKLSRLMRYLLYEADEEKVPLAREIEFLESYIELMRLRYDETKLSVDINYSESTKPVYIPSLLFLPLIENAFKHGIDTKSKSFVDVRFSVNDHALVFAIKNSNFPKTSGEFNEASGIGLENIRKRLNLIYGDNYTMHIHSDDMVYEIVLEIPIL